MRRRTRPPRETPAAARSPTADSLVEYFGGADKIPAHLRRPIPPPAAGTAPTKASLPPANVGTAAPGCPSGPERPGRSAAPPTPAQALSHNPPAATGRERSSEGAQECSPRRKPWVGQPRMNKPRRAYPERSRRGRKKMVRTPRHRRAQPKSAGILRCARRLASVTDVLRSE